MGKPTDGSELHSIGAEGVGVYLEHEGLPIPPIPAGTAPLRHVGDETFATRTPELRAYDIREWARRAECGRIEDIALVGIDGHGANSWCLHYYLVRGCMALMLQEGWGGIYMDAARQREEIAKQYEAARRLLAAVDEHEENARVIDRLLPRGQVRVIVSHYGSAWSVPHCSKRYRAGWRPGHEVVEEATKELREWVDRQRRCGSARGERRDS